MKSLSATVALLAAALILPAADNPKASGLSTAPITIEVFSDFQCPSCKLLHEQTLPRVMADYVQTGKAYLVHREFPLPMHNRAREAAQFATAAARVGKYNQACDVLFRQQAVWSASGAVADTVCSVLTPTEAKKVRELAKDPQIAAEVQRDVERGQKAKVTQTPTMIVTHRGTQYPIPGTVNYDLFRRFVDSLMNK